MSNPFYEGDEGVCVEEDEVLDEIWQGFEDLTDPLPDPDELIEFACDRSSYEQDEDLMDAVLADIGEAPDEEEFGPGEGPYVITSPDNEPEPNTRPSPSGS